MIHPDKVSILHGSPACLGRQFGTGLSTGNHLPQRKGLKTLVSMMNKSSWASWASNQRSAASSQNFLTLKNPAPTATCRACRGSFPDERGRKVAKELYVFSGSFPMWREKVKRSTVLPGADNDMPPLRHLSSQRAPTNSERCRNLATWSRPHRRSQTKFRRSNS